MLLAFQTFLQTQNLLQKGDRVLLAVSGGVDSIVMAELIAQTGFAFGIAHCNFCLRGQASDADEAFVEKIALHYQVPFYNIRFSETKQQAEQSKQSIQMVARDLRYTWLEKIRSEQDYKFIATAHHQNDVAETMLFNLCRGTGLAGLHGISSKNNKIIRPLLFATKESIRVFAQKHHLSFREDASNQEIKYIRNKIRHLVLPVFQEINPSVIQTLYQNAQHFAEIEQIYEIGLASYRKKLLEKNKKDVLISIRKLQQIKPLSTVLFELLRPYQLQNQVMQIIQSFDSQSGKVFYSKTHRLIKDRKFLIISEKNELETDFRLINKTDQKIDLPNAQLTFEQLISKNELTISRHPNTACLDADRVVFPLMLRAWKQGDYFYPFGMKRKKKKLSRFFIDLKLSLAEKERIYVLEDANKRIIWVVGHRIDERFRITEKSKTVLQIKKIEIPIHQASAN